MKKDKKLIQISALTFLTIACGISGQALAEPVATQGADGNFVPVVNAGNQSQASSGHENTSPASDFENAASITPSSDSTLPVSNQDPSLKDVLNNVGLSKVDNQFFIGNIENALKSLENVFYSSNQKTSSLLNVEKSFERLSDFVAEHSENKKVETAVIAVMKAFMARVEEKSLGRKEEYVEGSEINLLQSLLDDEEADHRVVKREVTGEQAARGESSPNAERQHDEIMDSVLDVLRQGSVNSQTSAVSRAIYRSWYLSLSKRARELRFSRLREMMLRQQNAEAPAF